MVLNISLKLKEEDNYLDLLSTLDSSLQAIFHASIWSIDLMIKKLDWLFVLWNLIVLLGEKDLKCMNTLNVWIKRFKVAFAYSLGHC